MTPPILKDAIEAFNTAVLNTLLQKAGVEAPPKGKEERIEAWRRLLIDGKRVRNQYERLPAVIQRALDLLRESGGDLTQPRYESLLVKAGLAQARSARGLDGAAQSPQKPGLLEYGAIRERLLEAGLIWSYTRQVGFAVNKRLDLAGGERVYVPAEVEAHLPPIRERVRTIPVPVINSTLAGSARTFQRDLYLVWSTAREQSLALTNAGLLKMSDLKRVARPLLVPETIGTGDKETDHRRILFLRRMSVALGLMRSTPDSTALEAEATAPFLTVSPAERVARSFATWRQGDWWNELWPTTNTAYGRGPGNVMYAVPPCVVHARSKVIDLLARLAGQPSRGCDNDGWIPVEALSEMLRDRDEEFLLKRSPGMSTWGAIAYDYGASADSSYWLAKYTLNELGWSWGIAYNDVDGAWERVERVFVETVLAEGLHWLGLVDLGFVEEPGSGGDGPWAALAAVRLTEMGRWLLLRGPQPAIPEEAGRVVLQPNYRIFAFDPISEGVLARLDAFATRLNAERAVEYELSQASVYRAQLAGQSVADIKGWLEQVTGAPLPQNVSRSMDEWAAAYERIVVRPRVGWVEAASAELADALARDPAIAPALIRRVSPTAFLVLADQVSAVEGALFARNETPVRSSGPALPDETIRMDPDGAIRSILPVPNLLMAAELGQFTDWDGAAWRVTRASIARARQRGLEPAALLEKLRALARGALPAELEAQIKAWSRHYGRVTVQTLTLAQFKDQETLDDLLTDRALRRLMKRFAPAARLGLAAVEPERVAELVAALEARGVEVVLAREGSSD